MNKPVVVTADLGFAKKARNFAVSMDVPLAFIEKRRISNDSKAQALSMIGDVRERDVVIVDDEVDTGGSMIQAVNLAKESGARDVYMVFVHPVLSANAVENLAALPVTEFITTDTIPIPPAKFKKFGKRMTSLYRPSSGRVILRAHEGRSVGELFNE